MKKLIEFIKIILKNNQKIKLSVLASSLVFFLMLAIIPFFELIEYILLKLEVISNTSSNILVFSKFSTTLYFIVYLIWISSKILNSIYQISDLIYYNIHERSHLKLRLLSFLYMTVIIFITIFMIVVLIYLTYLENRFKMSCYIVIEIIKFCFILLWIINLFVYLYKKVVPVKIKYKETLKIATIIGTIIYIVFVLYNKVILRYLFDRYLAIYGTYSSFISLIVFIYIICYIFLSGIVYLFMKNNAYIKD